MEVIHIFAGDLKSVSEGGIATYIRELIKRQIEDGIDVSLVGVTGDLQDNIGKWNEQKVGNKSFFFLPLFYTSKSHLTFTGGIPLNARFIWSLWVNKGNFLPKDCILHIHRIELALPFLLPRKKNPIVLTIHGIGKFAGLATTHILFNKSWFRYLYYKIESFVIRRVDKIILVSQEGMDYYISEFPRQKNKFILIPNSVDTELFQPMEKKNSRLKYHFRSDEKILLFVGRFDQAKGLDFLIDTFQEFKSDIPKTRLVLVGDGKEKDYLQRKVKRLKISEAVFMGIVEYNKLPEIMNCADVFVLTSLWEGMPLVVLEALACGLPVVSTNVGQLSEVIKNGVTGYLVDKRDSEEVKKKIILAFQTAKDMKEKCRETAQKFSSSVIAKKIEKVYNQIQQKGMYTSKK